MDIQEYTEEVREKISKVPDFDRGAVEPLLETLPYLDPQGQRKVMADIDTLVSPEYSAHVSRSKNPVLPFPGREESRGDGLVAGNVLAGDRELYPFELTISYVRSRPRVRVSCSGTGSAITVRLRAFILT